MNMITGAIAVILIAVFLGEYAVTIGSLPLWVIIVGVTAMMVADYIFSFKPHRELQENQDNDQE